MYSDFNGRQPIPRKYHAQEIDTGVCVSAIVLAACGGSDGSSRSSTPIKAQLFAQTDDTANAVIHFSDADGTLSGGTTVLTGGKGTGGVTFANGGTLGADSLTSDNSVIVIPDGERLFVTNASDNTVSVFSISHDDANPALLATSQTGGTLPTSSAFFNDVLYVTHYQGRTQLGAYRVGSDGELTQIGQYATAQANVLPATSCSSTCAALPQAPAQPPMRHL